MLLVLAFPNFSIPFIVETYASGVTIGAGLLHDNHSLAFFNKKLSPLMQITSTYARELYAITEIINK